MSYRLQILTAYSLRQWLQVDIKPIVCLERVSGRYPKKAKKWPKTDINTSIYLQNILFNSKL